MYTSSITAIGSSPYRLPNEAGPRKKSSARAEKIGASNAAPNLLHPPRNLEPQQHTQIAIMKSKRAREAAETAEAPANTNGADEPSLKKRKHTDDVDGAVKKSKKDKKDKKKGGETRKEKKDKRKDLQNLPDMDEPEEDEAEAVKEDKPKKDSKADTNGDESAKKKEKKEKKDKKKKEKKEKKETETKTENNNTATAPEGDSNGIDLDESTAKKNDRHIVFVGNLPFTATAATISAHFASLSPIAVRCLTNKFEKNKNITCKGIAFVEFGNVWSQRTCLDKFHHSMFDDGKSAPRKINVELT